jgi:type I restriction enzyme S subunit
MKPLDALVELVRTRVSSGEKDPEKRYIGLQHIAQGTPRLTGSEPSTESKSTNSVFRPGDILFGKLRPYLQKCVQVDFEGYCSTDILVLRPRTDVDPTYAAKVLQQGRVFRQAVRTSIGTRMPRTSWSDLKAFEIYLPPESEQRRIADVLDTVDAAIQETDAVVGKQEQVKTGLLQDLLTRGLDADGRLRDPERKPEAFRETELGLLPIGWRVVDLEAVTKRITDGSHQAVDTLPDASDGIPFLYVSCIRNGEIYWDQASSITRETFESISKSKEPKPGVILYTTVGSYGHAALVKDEVNFSFQRHVGYIDPDTDKVRPQFLAYWLDSEYCKRHADKIALGSSQKTVTLRDLARYPVPLPSYEEQKKIAERLDEIDSSIKGDRAYKNKLQNLKTGLMQDLLTGRVRVPEAEDRVDEVVA